jgi:hypothetical protein
MGVMGLQSCAGISESGRCTVRVGGKYVLGFFNSSAFIEIRQRHPFLYILAFSVFQDE